jgi:hypothetical protein
MVEIPALVGIFAKGPLSVLAARLEDLAEQHSGTVTGGAMIKQPLIQ